MECCAMAKGTRMSSVTPLLQHSISPAVHGASRSINHPRPSFVCNEIGRANGWRDPARIQSYPV